MFVVFVEPPAQLVYVVCFVTMQGNQPCMARSFVQRSFVQRYLTSAPCAL